MPKTAKRRIYQRGESPDPNTCTAIGFPPKAKDNAFYDELRKYACKNDFRAGVQASDPPEIVFLKVENNELRQSIAAKNNAIQMLMRELSEKEEQISALVRQVAEGGVGELLSQIESILSGER
jgi:hypothetical protein